MIFEAFTRWHRLTGNPILLADACVPGRDHIINEGFVQAAGEANIETARWALAHHP